MEPPQQRLTVRKIADDKTDRTPPNGFLKPAQLKLAGDPAPAPAAMRNLMAHVRVAAKLDVVLTPELVTADNPELFKFKFLYLHGRKRFTFTPAEEEGLRATLQSGGLLLADAACGAPAFDAAFREQIVKALPGTKLVPIPLDDPLYAEGVDWGRDHDGQAARESRRHGRRRGVPGLAAVVGGDQNRWPLGGDLLEV